MSPPLTYSLLGLFLPSALTLKAISATLFFWICGYVYSILNLYFQICDQIN